MKILHAILTDTFYGSERYCAELASEQAASGHEVCVLISDGIHAYRQNFARPGVRVIALPSWLPAILHRPAAARIIRSFGPDIVHSHLGAAARRVGHVAQRAGVAHVATLHLDYDRREHGGCDGLICVAAWQRDSIPSDHAGKIGTVHNWLPAHVADVIGRTTADEVRALREQWKALESTVVYGSIGRLFPEKGMDLLLTAFRQAFPAGDEDVRLVIVGDGQEKNALALQAHGDSRIVLAGWKDEVARHYCAFDVYVGAARFEPFGLTIVEAMAAGCPLILTRTQGPIEFVRDSSVRWCGVGESASLAQAMQDSSTARRRRSYDLAAFDPAAAVVAIDAIYNAAIEWRAGRAAAKGQSAAG